MCACGEGVAWCSCGVVAAVDVWCGVVAAVGVWCGVVAAVV